MPGCSLILPVLVPGQRLVSDSEPELGLGTLVSADRRSVVVRFDATDEERRYAAASAPLHRVTTEIPILLVHEVQLSGP